MQPAIKSYEITALRLDPDNPRLPESLVGADQSVILEFLYEHEALSELAQSFLDNGFFAHEPLIIEKERVDGKHTVLEGNRRLAALMILHGMAEAGELHFLDLEPTKLQLEALTDIPCFAIENKDDVHQFLGFRHIGGIKTWDAEAKARYLRAEVERAVRRKSVEPFREVARQVGSNAQGVRNPYLAISILVHARDEFGINVAPVQQDRFGVWLRCMNSKEIRTFIGLDSPKTYPEIQKQIPTLREGALREVVADLSPRAENRKPLLSDSRQVTSYGRILMNEEARSALRQYDSIVVAVQLVERASMAARVGDLVTRCRLVLQQLPFAKPSKELAAVTEQLTLVARSIWELAKGRLTENE